MSGVINSEEEGRERGLLDRVRKEIRVRHYILRTEEAEANRTRRLFLFHCKWPPSAMGGLEIAAFLSDLAVAHHVAAATQNQALSAILFLYRDVLHDPMPWIDDIVHARKPRRLPVVL